MMVGRIDSVVKDWYRRTTWTAEDAADFEERLGRARKYNRAQYLRIQACHLEDVGDDTLLPAALGLLDRILREYPDETFEIASTYLQRASCLGRLGDVDGQLEALRASLQAEREYPSVGTDAWLEFGWLVATRRMMDSYEEALAVLNEFAETLLFPIHRYKFHGTRALIVKEVGDDQLAREEARLALEAAAAGDSGLPYHPTVGLVEETPDEVQTRLEAIADS